MAGGTTVDLYDRVLEDKGPGLVGVALEADGVARGGSAELARFESAVRIVAIDALYKAFINAMVEGTGECLLHLQVAVVTELGLLLPHQVLRFLGIVRIVAVGAADIVLQVRGAPEVSVLGAVLVTAQAARAVVFRGCVLEREDLGFVPAAFHVFLTGTVARFTAVPFGSSPCVERRGEVR
jgi:hypothetical protein